MRPGVRAILANEYVIPGSPSDAAPSWEPDTMMVYLANRRGRWRRDAGSSKTDASHDPRLLRRASSRSVRGARRRDILRCGEPPNALHSPAEGMAAVDHRAVSPREPCPCATCLWPGCTDT